MKNLIIILLLFSFGCSTATNSDFSQNRDTITVERLPEIGDKLHDSIIQTSNNRGELVSSSQFLPSTTVKYQGNLFSLAWNKDSIVKYIATRDTNFVTAENVKVNMTLNKIKDIEIDKIKPMPGWAYYIKLNSGWSAALCVETKNGCTGRELLKTDTIRWLFK